MPELPEVETVRCGLERALRGHRLQSVEIRRRDLRWPVAVEPVRDLAGRRCVRVARRSKYLLLGFDGVGAPVAIVHLGMSGRLFVEATASRRAPPAFEPHEHWRLGFTGRLLRFVDPRRFGSLHVAAQSELAEHRLLRHLGPEPFDPEFDAEHLFDRSRRRRVAVKSLIMDARIVVGVGNIYACEALFRAGIRPRRPAGRLSRADCGRLAAAIRTTLAAAIEAGGTTLRDYIGVDRETGYFQQQLAVYGRNAHACNACGATIRRVVLGGRATYFCPGCQR